MKIQLAPSILSFELSRVYDKVAELIEAKVDLIHFDVMDGQFVPPITFGADLVKSLRPLGDILFEAHLMTATPERHFEAFAAAGCKRIIFHHEATAHAHRYCGELRAAGIEAGVAINPGTPVENLFPLLEVMDIALIMTVNPGWGGQKLISSCLDKVRTLRQLKPELDIEIDGGVDPNTIGGAIDAGANVFVTGSYLTGPLGVAGGVQELRKVCDSKSLRRLV